MLPGHPFWTACQGRYPPHRTTRRDRAPTRVWSDQPPRSRRSRVAPKLARPDGERGAGGRHQPSRRVSLLIQVKEEQRPEAETRPRGATLSGGPPRQPLPGTRPHAHLSPGISTHTRAWQVSVVRWASPTRAENRARLPTASRTTEVSKVRPQSLDDDDPSDQLELDGLTWRAMMCPSAVRKYCSPAYPGVTSMPADIFGNSSDRASSLPVAASRHTTCSVE